MKIKEVQISNFRAFNDVKRSTFNFLNNKNEISDLISIYAPNGFGKTSFYDAVEWGVTGKIQRFDIVGDFDRTKKENKSGGNKNILQHIGTTDNGFVNVVTEKEKFEEKITKREYNQKKAPKNKYFRDVVLSQEMIDNFLKEQTAEERFNKFVESYPEVTKYNNTHKNIGSLLNYIFQETKRLETEKKKSENNQLKIDFELEFKKFDQINDAIQFLKSTQEAIDLIEKETFNGSLNDVLTSQVKSRLVSLNWELKTKKLRVENFQLARNGDEKEEINGGVISYIDNKKKLADLELKIKEVENIILLKEANDKIKTEKDNLNDNLSREQNNQSNLLSIEKKIDTYFLLDKEIIAHEKRVADFNDHNKKIENENAAIMESSSRFQNEMAQLHETLKQRQNRLTELPNQKNKLDLTKKSLDSLQKEILTINDSITKKQYLLNDLQHQLTQLNYYENNIEYDIDLLLESDEFKSQRVLIEEQIKSINHLDAKKNELINIENKINSQNQFNNDLNEYVSRGLEIISKSHSSDCPLCNQHYESFEELSNRIVGNKIFSKQLKESLAEKVGLEEYINKLLEEINLRKERLVKHLEKLKQPLKTKIEQIEKDIKKLSLQKDEKNKELNVIESSHNEAILFFNNESNIDAIEKKLNEQIENLRSSIAELNRAISLNTSKISVNQTQFKSNNENIEIIKKTIRKIKSIKEYNEVIRFYKEVLNSNEVIKSLFEVEKQKLNDILNNLKSEIEDKQKLLFDSEKTLLSYNLSKDEYSAQLKTLKNSKQLILKYYENYENFIRTEFQIDLKNKNKEEINAEFDQRIEQEKSNQNIIESKIEKYNVVEALKDDCLNANVSQRIQIEINELKNKIKDLKVAEKKLNIEKKNLEKYLEKTIDEFFYTDLINAIYKKIEPHPDYELIEFKCEFGDNKPRLQVFTIKRDKDGKETKSIPALYFSTAQINILSLSIFLARALKTKNPDTGESIDCIFIDDPIQSMDSINILSFIDLFRGIMTSLGKQLIVSTHEENFHLLLQKKIPIDLFKSKFIEFETFGKLKKEVNI
mgnify:CR=1 FL=1|tara:strand:- start:556 stop:3705 length:3150 start_codon:yes stop_codon:yes gene_type:complete